MQTEIYTSPEDVEKFKNYKKITVRSFHRTNDFKMLINIDEVNILESNDNRGALVIQRYSPPDSTGPK